MIGSWLREQRKAKGWSQDELAFRSKVPARMIGGYERGQWEPSITVLVRLCDALEVDLPWTASNRCFVQTPSDLLERIRELVAV